MDEQFHGSFAAMQVLADFRQPLIAAVFHFNRLPCAGAEVVEADRQMGERIVGRRGVERQHRFQFQAKFRPRDFFSASDGTDVLAEQISRNAEQPRPDHRSRIEPGLGEMEPQKDFLRHILGVGILREPRAEKTEDDALMAFDDGGKSGRVPSPPLLNEGFFTRLHAALPLPNDQRLLIGEMIPSAEVEKQQASQCEPEA